MATKRKIITQYNSPDVEPYNWHSYARQRGREWAACIMANLPSEVHPCETPEGMAREMRAKMALLDQDNSNLRLRLQMLDEQLGEHVKLAAEQTAKLAQCESYLELILECHGSLWLVLDEDTREERYRGTLAECMDWIAVQ